MPEDLKEKLINEMQQADWTMLAPHHEKEAILIVDPTLDLIEVGVAMANDNIEVVKTWHTKKLLIRPSRADIEEWEKDKMRKMANFIIIQPFVLIQLIPEKLH